MHGSSYLHVVVIEMENPIGEVRQNIAELVDLAVCVEKSASKREKLSDRVCK